MLIGSITTLIQRLYLHIPRYNNTSQRVLKDFCNTFESISAERPIIYQSEFKKRLKQFDKKYRFNKIYYKLAFLWFACDFVDLIHKHLILGKKPLGFIHEILREVYQFVERQISLESIAEWEKKLQYECSQSIVPLLHKHYKDETQIFDRLNSLVDEYDLGALNPKRIQNAVRPSLCGPPWKPTQKVQIQTFFDLTQIVLDVHFYPRAFLLSRIFIYLRVNKSKEFKEYQRAFLSPDIQVSHIALVSEGSQESFIGRLVIPQKSFDLFVDFLQIGEEKGIFEIVDCQEMVDFKHSVSYEFYEIGVGWSFQTKQFKNIMRREQPLEYIDPLSGEDLHTIGEWNTKWSCLSSKKTEQIIESFCKYWRAFTYEELYKLAGHIKLNQDRTKLLEPHNKYLRELLSKGVLQIMMTPMGLIRSYSIDYWLVIPPRTVSREELRKLLIILPYTLSFELQNGGVRIFCFLDRILADFISNNLKWGVLPLRASTVQYNLKTSYFDFDSYSWKRPSFLKEKRPGKLHF